MVPAGEDGGIYDMQESMNVALPSDEDSQGNTAAAAADGSNDGESIFRKMELDDISMSQEDLGRSRFADLSETADGLAEMEEPGEANAIDMSDSSWNTELIPTGLEAQPSGAAQMR